MKHVAYITDLRTGRILNKIDLGSFSWSMTISDSAFSTTPNKVVQADEVSNVDVLWSAVPGNSQSEKALALMPDMRAIVIFSQDDNDMLNNGIGVPMIWCGIATKHSTWESLSLTAESVYQILADRIAVPEKWFVDGYSPQSYSLRKQTLRGIAAYVGDLCTSKKPGGELPIDWNYIGERHSWVNGENSDKHTRTYSSWNVNNISGKDIFDKIAGVQDGIDMQFRPYMSGVNHVRLSFVAGSDEEQYLRPELGVPLRFVCHDGAGNLENLEVDYSRPFQRVYATGAGEDAGTLTAFAEDLSTTDREDGLSLREVAMSDTDCDNLEILKREANARLDAGKTPLLQFTGEFDENDPGCPRVGLVHPGEPCVIDLRGYPDVPDGTYHTRIMELSGNEGSTVKAVFDAVKVPYF